MQRQLTIMPRVIFFLGVQSMSMPAASAPATASGTACTAETHAWDRSNLTFSIDYNLFFYES